jgi:L,D-peptidoglycan transpeptidase YkuD (ErfK/YbiS/YcfS/YnhG family)
LRIADREKDWIENGSRQFKTNRRRHCRGSHAAVFVHACNPNGHGTAGTF